jgi:nitroreductase
MLDERKHMTPNGRAPEVEVDSMFVDRWSPRAFLRDAIPEHQIKTLFEAARWAPSCFNEQPWLFMYATTPEDRKLFASALVEKNRTWAGVAPMLVFVLARRNFKHNDKPNRNAAFDAGAAWMSLALQARKLGLYAHGMAGFDIAKAYEVLGVSKDEYDVLAAVAVGRKGDASQLSPEAQKMEMPNGRKPLAEVYAAVPAKT